MGNGNDSNKDKRAKSDAVLVYIYNFISPSQHGSIAVKNKTNKYK